MTSLATTLSSNPISRSAYTLAKDRVVLSLFAGIVVLGVFHSSQVLDSLAFMVRAMLSIAPFFLLSVIVAAYANATGMDLLIARAFSGRRFTAIVIAAAVGALSPFCSCGVIPLIAAMLRAGVPLPAVMAFWIASPIMDPEMFILTAAAIDLEFALAKTLAAIGMGLVGGFVVLALQTAGWFRQPLRDGIQSCGCSADRVLKGGSVTWAFWREPARRHKFYAESKDVGWFLGKWLALAFFLESLMVAYIPADSVSRLLGGDTIFAIPLAAIVGVPTYLNGFAAIPLVGGLMEMGMSRGAGLAFMTAGGVSSIPAAIAVFSLVRKPVFATYLLIGLIGSMSAGALYSFVA